MSNTPTVNTNNKPNEDQRETIIGVLIVCNTHNKFAVTKSGEHQVTWIPSIKVGDDDSWTASASGLITTRIGSNKATTPPVMVHIQHKQIRGRWIKRIIFRSHLKGNNSQVKQSSGSKESLLKKSRSSSTLDLRSASVTSETSLLGSGEEDKRGQLCPCQVKNGVIWEPMDKLSITIEPELTNKSYNFYSDATEHKTRVVEEMHPKFQKGVCPKHDVRQEFSVMPRIIKMESDGEMRFSQVVPHHNIYRPQEKVEKFAHEMFDDVIIRRIVKMVKEHQEHLEKEKKHENFGKLLIDEHKKRRKDSLGQDVPWFKSDLESKTRDIEYVLRRAKEIFESEPKILKLQSPLYIFGDIHGNLRDLLTYDRHILRGSRGLSDNYLFLGDYVDRGLQSTECVLYLFCKKILNPRKVHLLRGNHEVAELQLNFTYRREVMSKFGYEDETEGQRVWNLFNSVFDVMPIAAIIDESIYTCHGGIPYTQTSLDRLEATIPKSMREPDKSSAGVWEILWSDPTTDAEQKEILEMSKKTSDPNIGVEFQRGYMFNSKRGAGYIFGSKALESFLDENILTHVIRAHEVIKNGFVAHFGGKVWTVFSSSKYQGTGNSAAAFLIQDSKIRPVSLETH